MADEDKTITIKFKGDTTQLNDSVSNVDKMIKVLRNDTKALEKQMKFNGNYTEQMDLYNKAIDNVTESIYLAEHNQNKWNAEIEKYQEIMKVRPLTDRELNALLTAQRKYAEVTKQIENYADQQARLNREKENYIRLSLAEALDQEGTKLKNIGDGIQKVANSFKYISAAAGAALTGAGKAAIDFESAMANVRKVLKPEEKSYFDVLQQQVLDMSRELPITAQEIAQVTANALQLGVSAKDVGKFTDTILKLGTATNISADEAAIAIAQFFNITGESLQNVDKFGAVLTDLGNNFPTFESDIMEMATRIAAAGTSVKMSTRDILGLSTALASVGLSAEAGGTAISQILRTIDTQVATSGKKLEKWAEQAGMSVDEFKKAWRKDATGTFQLLVNSLAEGVDNGENLNAMLKNLGINAIRQTDAFSRLVQANDTFNEALKESGAAWEAVEKGEEGALNDEFAERVKTLASQFQILKNSLFVLGVTIGNQLLPYMQKVVDFVKSIVTWFTNLSPVAQKWITGLLVGITALYPALKGLGMLLSLTGDGMKGLAKALASKIMPANLNTEVFKNLILGIKDFTSTMALPIAAITAFIASFARLYKTSDQFKAAINGIAELFGTRLTAATATLIYYLREFWEWLGDRIMPLIEYLKELYHSFIGPTLAYLYSAIAKLVTDVIADVYAWLVMIARYLLNALKPAIEIIINVIRAVAGILTPVIAIIIKIIGLIVELVDYLWNKAKPFVTQTIEAFGKIVEWLANVVSTALAPVWEALKNGLQMIGEAFSYLKQTNVVTRFGQAFQNIIEPIKTVFEWVKKVVDKINEWAGKAPTINEMAAEAGYRYSGTTVYNTNNITQKNTVNGVNSGTAQRLADDVLNLVNNGIGKQLDTRGW